MTDETSALKIAPIIKELGAKLYAGPAGLTELVRRDDVDIVVAAVVARRIARCPGHRGSGKDAGAGE